MSSTLSKIVIFSAGALIGSAATWKVVEEKYKRIADEEIESVKEVFSLREQKYRELLNNDSNEEEKEEKEENDDTETKSVKNEYEKIANRYTRVENIEETNNEPEQEEDNEMMPFVISPDEFGDCDYETTSLTYYADGILTDMMDNIIEDVEGLVGEESLTHFGEYEEDTVYVRNHEREEDFEICLDEREYYDVYPLEG